MNDARIPEEEIVARGRGIYARDIAPTLGSDDEEKFVVIDIRSGDYEISDDEEQAFERAERKHPEALFFILRVGPNAAERPAYRVGAGNITRPHGSP